MDYRIAPWAHQLKAIETTKGRDHFALFFEQGCGKTSTLINILRHKFLEFGQMSTLILCPQIVIENWKREILAHSEIPESEIYCLTGKGFDRMCDFERFIECKPRRIVITNYESLLMETFWKKKLKPWEPEVVVLDESHKCKEMTAKRTKLVMELSKTAKFRFILSGTPVVNSAFDIFSQFLFLDQGETFGPSIYEFKKEYFVDLNSHRPRHCYFPNWQPKSGALSRLNEKVYKKAMRVTKAECLDLPPLVKQIVEFDLRDQQQTIYRNMEADAIVTFKESVVSADLAIKKALRLQQIVTGFVNTDDGNCKAFVPNPRLDALEEVIETIDREHKIIIWAVFKQNYEDIRRLLRGMGIGFVEVHGEVSAKGKQEAVDAFNSQNPNVRVLIGHPSSGGVGVNLTAASYAIFYSRGFSLENDLQAEARNHRGGSERHKSVTRIDLVARHTVDEVVLMALANKMDVSEAILKYMKGRR